MPPAVGPAHASAHAHGNMGMSFHTHACTRVRTQTHTRTQAHTHAGRGCARRTDWDGPHAATTRRHEGRRRARCSRDEHPRVKKAGSGGSGCSCRSDVGGAALYVSAREDGRVLQSGVTVVLTAQRVVVNRDAQHAVCAWRAIHHHPATATAAAQQQQRSMGCTRRWRHLVLGGVWCVVLSAQHYAALGGVRHAPHPSLVQRIPQRDATQCHTVFASRHSAWCVQARVRAELRNEPGLRVDGHEARRVLEGDAGAQSGIDRTFRQARTQRTRARRFCG